MRIIAGELKGRTIGTPAWEGLRPTSDRLRETIFNILAPAIRGARFVDGYAGTGAVGLEALSRGAAHVTFVEQDRRAAALIASNLQRCGVDDRYAIIPAGFAGALARSPQGSFDIIFIDPPYGAAQLAAALAAAEAWMSDTTLLVVEHARRDESPAAPGSLERTRVVRSGDSALSFFRRPAAGDSTGQGEQAQQDG